MFRSLPFPFSLLSVHLSQYCRFGDLDDMPECVCKLREFGIRGRRFHRSIIPHGASEAISMSEYDEVWRVLVSIMEIMKQQSEFAGRTHARLVVLRKAIAS